MQVRQNRTRNAEQQSTWSLVATIAVLVLGIIIIAMHLISQTLVEEPIEGNHEDVQTVHANSKILEVVSALPPVRILRPEAR